MEYKVQFLIDKYPEAFKRCLIEISHGNNLHRGFTEQEILNSLNNLNVFTGGIKVELSKELNSDGLYLKVWYSSEYYVGVSC